MNFLQIVGVVAVVTLGLFVGIVSGTFGLFGDAYLQLAGGPAALAGQLLVGAAIVILAAVAGLSQ